MRLFKLIDLWGQVILIPLSILFSLNGSFTFLPYILVGSWQTLSLVMHLLMGRHYLPVKGRKIYAILSFTALGGLLLFFQVLPELSIGYGYGMLLVTPFLAIWYVYICYQELRRLERKAFIHLK